MLALNMSLPNRQTWQKPGKGVQGITKKAWKNRGNKKKKKTQQIDMNQFLPKTDEQLLSLAKSVEMSPFWKQKYLNFQQQVAEAIQKAMLDIGLNSKYSIQPFGSIGSDLALRDSDLDLAIIIENLGALEDRKKKIKLLHRIKQCVSERMHARCIVIQARFPILKINQDKMEIDLSVNDAILIPKRLEITRKYIYSYKHFRTLYLIIHNLMVKNGLGSNQDGGIGGWALQQMIYVVLHSQDVLLDTPIDLTSQEAIDLTSKPIIDLTGEISGDRRSLRTCVSTQQESQSLLQTQEDTLVKQLLKFLQFYGHEFDEKSQVVDPIIGKVRQAQANEVVQKNGRVVIFDAVVSGHSLVSFGKWQKVKQLFSCVYDNMQQQFSWE
eukprot:TRINITY_DN7240_c0_g1_i2.p1 TRINITY_DN7240_c0_g1~~TRINITY_DN7240_c0_g1_i2.p1  ORF type:complete len:381 (-),score=36.59 TRINITY_DN7240_c0_g1_i2:78-1220(-)